MTDKQKTELRIECTVYSRIVGYMTPLSSWNAGKRQEYAERVEFDANKAHPHK